MKKTHTSFLMKAAKSKHTKTLAAYLALNFIVIQAVFFPGVAFAISDPIDSMQTTLTQSTVPVSTNEPTPTPTLTESTQDDTTFLNPDTALSPAQSTTAEVALSEAISLKNGGAFVYDTDATGRYTDENGNERAYIDVHEIRAESSPILIPGGDGRIRLEEDEIWIGMYTRDDGAPMAIVGKRVEPLPLPELTHEIIDITDVGAVVNATVPLADGQYVYLFVRDEQGVAATFSLERIGQSVIIPCDGYENTDCIASLDPAQMEYPYRFTGKLSGLKPDTAYTYEIRIYHEPNSWDVVQTTPPVTFRTLESTLEISIGTPTVQLSSSGLSAQIAVQFNSNLPYGNLPFGSRITLNSRSLETGVEYSQIVYDGTATGVRGGTWNYIFMPPASSHGDYIIGDLRDSTAYLVTHPGETTTLEYRWTLEWYDWVTVGDPIFHTLSNATNTITFGTPTTYEPPPDPPADINPSPIRSFGLGGCFNREIGQIHVADNAVSVDQAGNAIFKVGASNILSGQIVRLALMDEGGTYRFYNMMADGSGNYLFNWYLNRFLRYRYYFSIVGGGGQILSQTQERVVEPVEAPAEVSAVENPTAPLSITQDATDPMPLLMTAADDEECGGGCLPDCKITPPVINTGGNVVTIDPSGNAVFTIGVSNLLSGQIVRLALMDDGGVYRFYNMLADGYGHYLFNQYLNRYLRYKYYFMVVDSYGNNLVQTQESVIEPVAPPEVSIGVPTRGDVTETTGTVKVNAQLPIGYKLTLRIVQGPTSGEVTMTPDFSVPQVMGCAVGYVCSSAFIGTLNNLVESADYQVQVVMTDPKGEVVKTSDLLWFGTKGVIDDLETLVRHHPSTRLLSDTRYNPNFDFNDDHSVNAIDQLMMRNIATIAKQRPDIFDRIYTKIVAEVSARLGAIRDAERPTGPLYEPELDPNHDGKIDEVDREMIKSALIKVRLVMDAPTATPKAFNALIRDHIEGLPADWKVYAMVEDPVTGEWTKHEMKLPAWQNQKNPLDVDGNGVVEQADAQLVIDRLLIPTGSGPVDEAIPAPPYYDVNGDDMVSPIDALNVINYLNSGTTSVQSAHMINLENLASETTYQYYVMAYDGQNKELSRSSVSSLTTPAPSVFIGVPVGTESTQTTVSVSVVADLPVGYSLTLKIVDGPTSGQTAMAPDLSAAPPATCKSGYVCSTTFVGTLENLKPGSDYQIQVVMTKQNGEVIKSSTVKNLKTQNPPILIDAPEMSIRPQSAAIQVHVNNVPEGGNVYFNLLDPATSNWTAYQMAFSSAENVFEVNVEGLNTNTAYQYSISVMDGTNHEMARLADSNFNTPTVQAYVVANSTKVSYVTSTEKIRIETQLADMPAGSKVRVVLKNAQNHAVTTGTYDLVSQGSGKYSMDLNLPALTSYIYSFELLDQQGNSLYVEDTKGPYYLNADAYLPVEPSDSTIFAYRGKIGATTAAFVAFGENFPDLDLVFDPSNTLWLYVIGPDNVEKVYPMLFSSGYPQPSESGEYTFSVLVPNLKPGTSYKWYVEVQNPDREVIQVTSMQSITTESIPANITLIPGSISSYFSFSPSQNANAFVRTRDSQGKIVNSSGYYNLFSGSLLQQYLFGLIPDSDYTVEVVVDPSGLGQDDFAVIYSAPFHTKPLNVQISSEYFTGPFTPLAVSTHVTGLENGLGVVPVLGVRLSVYEMDGVPAASSSSWIDFTNSQSERENFSFQPYPQLKSGTKYYYVIELIDANSGNGIVYQTEPVFFTTEGTPPPPITGGPQLVAAPSVFNYWPNPTGGARIVVEIKDVPSQLAGAFVQFYAKNKTTGEVRVQTLMFAHTTSTPGVYSYDVTLENWNTYPLGGPYFPEQYDDYEYWFEVTQNGQVLTDFERYTITLERSWLEI